MDLVTYYWTIDSWVLNVIPLYKKVCFDLGLVGMYRRDFFLSLFSSNVIIDVSIVFSLGLDSVEGNA